MPGAMDALLATVARVWGFPSLRPLQERAIAAVLAGRDSLVVMPTGGGKSLCYQAPAVHRGGTTVVVSPLIALMKDQVDALNRVGVPAVRLDSSQSSDERFESEAAVRDGTAPIVFISPERLALPGFAASLRGVHAVAIDEAHCISHWGHDFRPEYRQLLRIREHFPDASVHGYTATATEKVREDIVAQLGLRNPDVLVGNFDRPNLSYRVLPKLNLVEQVREVIDRHPNSAGIIYCLRRRDVDDLAASLAACGVAAFPYHAGMTPDARRTAQDKFAKDDAPVVCATIAFGMGIDRPDVRFVVHGAMPKSIEHYQQETGRAGRDGFPAECVLFFSGGDVITLKRIIQKTAEESGETSHLPAVFEQLNAMDRYCRSATCRHRSLVNHFGQRYEPPNCAACDVCLGDTDAVPDAKIVAQKILSCVFRVKESFGAAHVSAVLRGENTEAIRSRGHDKLSTFGLLKGTPKPTLRDWVFQLVGQDVLVQTQDEYPVLKLNPASWEVMRGERDVRLLQLARRDESKKSSPAKDVSPPHGPNEDLFETLRTLRKELAAKENVPAYRIFPDVVLTAFATTRPTTVEAFRQVSGVGEVKFKAYGDAFLTAIRAFDTTHPRTRTAATRPLSATVSPRKQHAFDLFRQGTAVPDVMHQLNVARSTAFDYLAEYVTRYRPDDVSHWISKELIDRVTEAAGRVGTEKLKPIFEALNQEVTYDDIRVVVAFLRGKG